MSIRNDETVRIAVSIKQDNPDINAPINDIAVCVEQLSESGLTNDRIRETVPAMFADRRNDSQTNAERHPNPKEILLYNMPDDYLQLCESPQ